MRSVDEFPYVLWIGGPAGAGKTTVARRIARRHGLRWYNHDAQTWRHLDRALAAGIPNARRFAALTPAERRLALSEHIDYDRGPMIVEDLRTLPSSPGIVVDSAPPEPTMVAKEQAVWLLPSRAAQRARLEQRHPDGVPPRYMADWERFANRAAESGAPIITVDDLTVEQTVVEVERRFARRLAEGPTASTIARRRELLRYVNRTIVEQHLGWLAHNPDPNVRYRDISQAVREFDCECGQPDCIAMVPLSIGVADPATAEEPPAIVAAGHPTD